MVEDPLLYCLTLFTFAIIFGLCYIRYVFTFFENHRIPAISTPTFPYGNIGDVITRENVLFIKLWKYYKYCRRHKHKFAGFYLFLKPAIVITDRQYFNIETVSDCGKRFDYKFGRLVEFFHQPWCEILANLSNGELDCGQLVNEYVIVVVLKIFNLDKLSDRAIVVDYLKRKTANFWSLFRISYPYFERFCPQSPEFKAIIQNLVNHRKKNDIRENDIVQILIDAGCDLDEITHISLETVKNLEIACNLLLLGLLELALNQEIQDDLRGEIARFTKNKTLNDFKELSYLDTIVSETLRKYPATPLIWSENPSFPDIPNGLVFISIFGIHHDPEYYPNPEVFDPDRFSEENLHFIDSNHYLPFGKRNSDGLLVRLIMKMALIQWIPKYQLTIGRKTKKPVNFDENIDGIKPKDICLNFKRL